MPHPWRPFLYFGTLIIACVGGIGGEPAPELKPSEVTFSAAHLPLQDVLAQVQKQTGNRITDRRADRTNPTMVLPKKTATFWQTLDLLGQQAGVGVSAYQPDGQVALVDTPHRPLKTDYYGIFRFAFKRMALSKDEETGAHHCDVTLDVAWEPRFRSLFVNLEGATVAYDSSKRKSPVQNELPRQAARKVVDISATEFEIRMNAPERAVERLRSLAGKIRVIGVPRMLDFAFAAPAPGMQAEKDGVKVRMLDVKKLPKRWEIEVEVEHPAGALIKLDSFQMDSLTHYNRVALTWDKSRLEASGEAPARKGSGVAYTFTAAPGTPLPAKDADVTLVYTVPGRVGAFTVPFAFQDLPLP